MDIIKFRAVAVAVVMLLYCCALGVYAEEPATSSESVADSVAMSAAVSESSSIPSNIPVDSDSTSISQADVAAAPAVDYSAEISEVISLLGFVKGILIFFVVVILCYFTYKFFSMFF